MRNRICPFCKEQIHLQALVCRYCRRDLPPVEQRRRKNSHVWLAAIIVAGVITGGAAFLATEFMRERKNWLAEPPRPPESQTPPD